MKKTTKKNTKSKSPTTRKTARGERSSKVKEHVGEAKSRRVSALDAAAQVLKSASKPMRAQELIAVMAEQGLWSSPAGKTPHATLYAAMLREVAAKGDAARFKKVDRGLFEFNKAAK